MQGLLKASTRGVTPSRASSAFCFAQGRLRSLRCRSKTPGQMVFLSAANVGNRREVKPDTVSEWKISALPDKDLPDVPKKPYPLTNVLVCVAAACAGAFAFGYHVAVINGPLEAIALDLGFGGNKVLEGAVVSMTLVGAALGSLTGGGLADNFGRRTALLLACAPLVAGPLLCAWASSFNLMAIGRFVTGVAIGLTSAVVPTYINEVSPNNMRGTLGALNQLTICVGILAVLLVNVALPATQWRDFFLLGTIPAVVLLLGILRCPESPHWLQSQRSANAQVTARQLWGPQAADELGAVATPSTDSGAKESVSWLDLLSPKYRRGVLMGCTLFAIQQFAGINALVYFSTAVFRHAGVASDTLASAAVGATNVLGTVLAASLIERTGRKQLLIGSYIGQGVAMLSMAAGFSVAALSGMSGSIAVVGTLAYILAFAFGAGPITALIIPEFNPVQVKGRVMAAAMTTHWICNVAIGQTFMALVAKYGLGAVYAGFGLVALLGARYIHTQIPETKGKTNEQVALELGV